ncbi:hypothetical protein TNCV_1798171 [Trichonephila clavipes]|nr:hypothetical protein TNCV_1798171 [Trichonephila clavipes]
MKHTVLEGGCASSFHKQALSGETPTVLNFEQTRRNEIGNLWRKHYEKELVSNSDSDRDIRLNESDCKGSEESAGVIVMGGRRSLRIATVIFISALLLFTRKGISGSVSYPTEKGDAFPTPGRRQCTHKYIMVWDVFWEFPAFGGSHRPREDIPPLTPDQSEKLIVFRKRILSRIHK